MSESVFSKAGDICETHDWKEKREYERYLPPKEVRGLSPSEQERKIRNNDGWESPTLFRKFMTDDTPRYSPSIHLPIPCDRLKTGLLVSESEKKGVNSNKKRLKTNY